jgi:LysM repeat protein
MRKFLLAIVLLCLSACAGQPNVIVITATYPPPADTLAPATVPPVLPAQTLAAPTVDPTRVANLAPLDYTIAPGDTLSAIAAEYGTSIDTLLALNDLPNPDTLFVGQTLKLPGPPTEEGSSFKILPDSRLVRAPGSAGFNVEAFVSAQPGYLKNATDKINNVTYSGAQLVQRAALEYSVDPRLLLALLEYKSGFLTNPTPNDTAKDFPLGAPPYANGVPRKGLYLQLAWAADQLNYGYYRWHLKGGLTSIEFTDGTRRLFAPSLNSGTVGVQYLLGLNADYPTWAQAVSENGFYRTYVNLFGEPFGGTVDPVVPDGVQQPTLALPFPHGQTWYYTGGWHGGWGDGGAWAAVDFAPPDDLTEVDSACYQSQFFATAVADGVIARTAEGTVILDLDGDGDESTGWTILYLHMAAEGRVAEGAAVKTGDDIGHPSCEGGFSTGTHMHIARRYNGEWIPVSCEGCAPGYVRPSLVMGGWTFYGFAGQLYQGSMAKSGETRAADQGRNNPDNQVSW